MLPKVMESMNTWETIDYLRSFRMSRFEEIVVQSKNFGARNRVCFPLLTLYVYASVDDRGLVSQAEKSNFEALLL